MRRAVFTFFILLFCFIGTAHLPAYNILYAEQFYKLFHYNFYRYPEDFNENIFYLEEALKADFVNPLNALAKIENKQEWERYRYLFKMHVNLKLVELYLGLGSKFDKRKAYFFNQPWRTVNLKSLQVAEKHYRSAFYYWDRAKEWASKIRPSFKTLQDVQYWEDQFFEIRTGELDYEDIIDSHLERLENVREQFREMDEDTY
jgi:hypothetical protein